MVGKDVLGTLKASEENILKVKKLSKDATLPTRGTVDSAGLDLYALEDYIIEPQQNVAVHTGIAMSIPKGYVGLLFARSGLATKQLLRPANCVGVIDSDYRGEIILSLYNDNPNIRVSKVYNKDKDKFRGIPTVYEKDTREIKKGDRVAQIVIVPYLSLDVQEVEELSDTSRGEGGFGSTGIN